MTTKDLTVDVIHMPVTPDYSVSIADYGAIGNGIYDNTTAVQRAIDACSAAGGGRVVIPPGIWLTGPIALKSKIELHVEEGALVTFSKKFEDYPLVMSSYEGKQMYRCQAPLDGEGLEDIAITGKGVFDGGGEAWRPIHKSSMTQRQWDALLKSGGALDDRNHWWPSQAALDGQRILRELEKRGSTDKKEFEKVKAYLRPCLLSLRKCSRIMLDGPTFQNSPAWCLHPWASQHVTVQNVNVRNPWYSANGDGLDIDSCKYVKVEGCTFDVGDDAICLKSGKNEAGRLLGMPCEHITIRNCTVFHGHGGIVVGSEMSGDVRNVRASDCTFIGTDIGIRFKSCRGRGGVVEDIVIQRIRMKEIAGDAISFNLYYEGKAGSGEYGKETEVPVTVETPQFRNILVEDIVCDGADTALLINGLPEMPVRDFTFRNAVMSCEQGIVCRNGNNITIEHVDLHTQKLPVITLHQSQTVKLNTIAGTSDVDWLHVTGEKSSGIEFRTSDPSQNKVKISPEVKQDEVAIR